MNHLKLFVLLLLLSCGCSDEPQLLDITFKVINNTDGTLLVEYDYVEEDCELYNRDCSRLEIADNIFPGAELDLYITDQTTDEININSLFERFKLSKNLKLSSFDFWSSSFISQSTTEQAYSYELTVDESFFE